MKRSGRWIVIAACLLLVGTAQAETPEDAQQWAEALEKIHESAFKTDFQMEMNGAAIGEPGGGMLSGHMVQRDASYQRITIDASMDSPRGTAALNMLVVADGTSRWLEVTQEGAGTRVLKMALTATTPQMAAGPLGGTSEDPVKQILVMLQQLDFEIVEQDDAQVLLQAEVTADAGLPQGIDRIRVRFDKATRFVRELIIGDDEPLVRTTFEGFEQVPMFPDAQFVYTPAEGIEVIDTKQMMGGS